jgi:hypothetical protein
MFDYSAVAVEIWHQILLAVIDLPYLLDTNLDGEMDLWRNSTRYHDHKVYAESECQRKTLRLVCGSWRSFADEHRYRWITYDSRSEADPEMQREALEAIESASSNSTGEGTTTLNKPRRIMFSVVNEEDMNLFRTTVDHCSRLVTTFFTKCDNGYENQVFEYLINQSSNLPFVRCLAIHGPNMHGMPMPLRAVSKAFPQLVTFAIWNDRPFYPRDGDVLVLPGLEELELDLSVFWPSILKEWHLPTMINLTTPISQLGLEHVKTLGANLTYLNIYRVDTPICLPVEFWAGCPRLVELLCFFSWIYLDTPTPVDHPLKYVVHWPHYDNTINPLIEGTRRMTDPVVLLSLQHLPPGVKIFVVWQSWPGYLDILRSRYNRLERRNILVRMNELSSERSIRVEDEHRVGLDEFLAGEYIKKMESDPSTDSDSSI